MLHAVVSVQAMVGLFSQDPALEQVGHRRGWVHHTNLIDRELAHYRITARLGSGGMGDVYRAEDGKLGRAVALKVLPERMAADADRLSRFRREAQTVAGLNHPNIVTLHSVDEVDGIHFLTMELVEGKTLDQLLPANGYALERFFEMAIPIADAVASAHAQGVVHRDLKPGNVMVAEKGERVVVLDFGLSKQSGIDGEGAVSHLETMGTTQRGAVVGTPLYMAPEQARGEGADRRSDVFALGVVLFEMATGERPFKGGSAIELLSSVLRDEPPSATDLRPDLPLHLAQIIGRCLEKDPNDRYQSAQDVLVELKALRLEATSGLSRSSSVGLLQSPGVRHTRPSRAVIASAAVAVAFVALAIALGWWPFGREAPRTKVSGRRVVAVLPFDNVGSSEDEFFADGVTDEITSRLSLIRGLGIISRTSARVYKGTRKPATVIGRELGAEFLLEGSIRWDRTRDPSRVRIASRLIRVGDDTQLWSGSFERETMEIFSVQSEIAEQIAVALDLNLVTNERRALTNRPTDSAEAYQAYLRGMEQLNAPGFSRRSFELGAEMFQRAVELDPDFALAYARLSSMHSRMVHYGFDRSDSRTRLARAAADRALALQPDLAEAQLALGHYHYWCERDYTAALAALEEALELAPSNNEVWLTIAYVKRRQGNFEAAIELFERDFELSPFDPNAAIGLGETYGTLRRYDEGERALQRAIDLAPDDPYGYTELALLYLRWRGDSAAARRVLERMPPAEGSEVCRVGFLVELLDRRYEAARQRLAACPDDVVEAGIFALPTALLEGMALRQAGEVDRARDAFERSRQILEARLAGNPDDHRTHSALGLTLAGLGRVDAAILHGRRAVELYPLAVDALQAPSLHIYLALTYAMAGAADEALEELDLVLSRPSILSTAWLEKDPRWDLLRSDPRFERLLHEHAVGPRT